MDIQIIAGAGAIGGLVLIAAWFLFVKKKQPRPAQETTKQEVKREAVPGKVQYEIVRQKDERSIVVKKGKIGPKAESLNWKKRTYYPNHIIKETRTMKKGKNIERYFVRWNMYYSEAYDVNGNISYDLALENNLMNDMENQLGKAVGAAVGFVLERPIIYLLIMAFAVAIPIGFSYNDILHLVPTTVVHWVPR